MPLRKSNESSDHLEDEDLTDELVEWANARRASVSETTPGRMGSPEGAEFEPDLYPSDSESMLSGAETAALIKSNQQPKVLVIALNEITADRAQAYLFDDTQEASQFIETLVETGLDPDRIIVFCGTPMNFQVSHRLEVTVDEPE
ncbi:MAG: hypothetical protein JSU97_08240 [Dehalococcoidia bacterium]|nr:MAG: hypothetical protein JSU97_08240 [Dehalococcoidia bacterium]